MRSRLEASFATMLDEIGCAWAYEPECFADETGQYLPDFKVQWTRFDRSYIEVKPSEAAAREVVADGRMERIWSSDQGDENGWPQLAIYVPVAGTWPRIEFAMPFARESPHLPWNQTMLGNAVKP